MKLGQCVIRGLLAPAWILLPLVGGARDLGSGDLDEITVTATRLARPVYEVPAAADTVLLRSQINTLGVNLSDMTGGVAGLAVRDRLDYAQDQQISVRGFGARAQFGIVGVRLVVDGIPATMPDGQGQASHIDLDAAERIEVLRGPFSALYGNASGGVIQIFTTPGSQPASVRVRQDGASFGTWRSALNALGVAAGVGYNFDYSHFSTEGWRVHSQAHRDATNLRLDLGAPGAAQLTVIANALSSPDAQDEGALTQAQRAADPQQADPTALQYNTRKSLAQQQLGMVGELPLGDGLALHGLLYAGNRTVQQFLSTPQTSQGNPRSPGGVVDLANGYGGAELRLRLDTRLLERDLALTAGLGFDDLASHRRGYNNFIGTQLGVLGALRRDELDRLYDFDQYLQAEWQLGARFTVLAGLRRSAVHLNSADHFITATNPNDSGQVSYQATTPVASVLYRLSPAWHLYAALGRGFDTPTFDNLAYRPDGAGGLNLALQPALTRQAELGAKWRPSASVFGTLALFEARTDNEIAVFTSQGGRSTYHNVGSTRRQGVELELAGSAAAAEHWQLAYTRLLATYRSTYQTCASSVCTPPASEIIVPSGNTLPGVVPQNLYAAWRHGGAAGWNWGVEGTALGRVMVNDGNSQSAPGYGLLGVNGGYGWVHAAFELRGYLRIDNLLDQRYVSAVVVNDVNGRFFQPGAGRSFSAGLALTWR